MGAVAAVTIPPERIAFLSAVRRATMARAGHDGDKDVGGDVRQPIGVDAGKGIRSVAAPYR